MLAATTSSIAGRSLDSFLGPSLGTSRCQTKINQDGSIIFDRNANLYGSRDGLTGRKSPKMSRDRIGTPTPSGDEIVSLEEANKRGSKSSDDFVFADKIVTSVVWGPTAREENATDAHVDALTMLKHESTPLPSSANSTPSSPVRFGKNDGTNSGTNSGSHSSSKSSLGQKIRKFVRDRKGPSRASVDASVNANVNGTGVVKINGCTSFSNSVLVGSNTSNQLTGGVEENENGQHSSSVADFTAEFMRELATARGSASSAQQPAGKSEKKKEKKKSKKAKATSDIKGEKCDTKQEKCNNKPLRSDYTFDKYDRYNNPSNGATKSRAAGSSEVVNARGPRLVVAQADTKQTRGVERVTETNQKRVSGMSMKACISKHGSLSSAIQEIGSVSSANSLPDASPFPQRLIVLTKTSSITGNDGMEVLDTESPASPVQRRSNRFFIAPKDMDVRLVVGDAVKLTRPTVPTRPVDESRPPKAMRSSVTRPGSVPLSSAQDRNIHRQAEMRPTSGLLSSTLDKAVICGDEIRPKNGLLLSAAHPPASAPVPTGSGVRNRRALMVSSRTAYVDFVGSHETVL